MTSEQPEIVEFGEIYAHAVTLEDAIQRIVDRVDSGVGGYVVTPNVDHICIAEYDEQLRSAYKGAFLSLPDGQPLIWMARLFGTPLPAKVSGSDLVLPLLMAAGERRQSVYFVGSTESVCEAAANRIARAAPGLKIVGWSCPRFDPSSLDTSEIDRAIEAVRVAKPSLVLVALGNPKQEYFMARYEARYHPAVALGVGATLDFIAGSVARAPVWMQQAGLEWVYRLVREPGRLWRRYLVRDRAIVGIFLRTRARAVRSAR